VSRGKKAVSKTGKRRPHKRRSAEFSKAREGIKFGWTDRLKFESASNVPALEEHRNKEGGLKEPEGMVIGTAADGLSKKLGEVIKSIIDQ